VIVDSHVHAAANWYEPAESLLAQMDRCGVARAVLIQLLGRFDNGYQQAWAARLPDRLASVVAVDPAAADPAGELRRLAEAGAAGVRLRPDAPEGLWQAAADLGLPVSCVGTAAAFTTAAFAARLAAASAPVVLEHLGGLARPDVGDIAAMRGPVLELARLPHAHLKMPGLGQLAVRGPALPPEGPPFDTGAATALLRAAVAAFGAERTMWGSDYPVVSSREGYANALAWPQAALAGLSDHDRAQVFGEAAARVFFRNGRALDAAPQRV
jgi:L-fuconolactonase